MKVKQQEPYAGTVVATQAVVTCGLPTILGQIKQRWAVFRQECSYLSVWFLVCLFFLCGKAHGESLKPVDFIGPQPGITYYYEDGDVKITWRGITWDQEGVLLIEQTTTFPFWYSLKNGCNRELTELFGVYVDEGRLMKKRFPLNGSVVHKVDLDLKNSTWGNPIRLMDQESNNVNDGEKTTSECRIARSSKQQLFGKTRTVLEVAGKFCVPRKYASGIGLVEYSGMVLVRIGKRGLP